MFDQITAQKNEKYSSALKENNNSLKKIFIHSKTKLFF